MSECRVVLNLTRWRRWRPGATRLTRRNTTLSCDGNIQPHLICGLRRTLLKLAVQAMLEPGHYDIFTKVCGRFLNKVSGPIYI